MRLVVRLGEQTQVDSKVQCLDKTALGFGLAGVIGDLGQALLGFGAQDLLQTFVGAAGGKDADGRVDLPQARNQLFQAGFVRNADQYMAQFNEAVDFVHDVDGHPVFSPLSIFRPND